MSVILLLTAIVLITYLIYKMVTKEEPVVDETVKVAEKIVKEVEEKIEEVEVKVKVAAKRGRPAKSKNNNTLNNS